MQPECGFGHALPQITGGLQVAIDWRDLRRDIIGLRHGAQPAANAVSVFRIATGKKIKATQIMPCWAANNAGPAARFA